MTTKRTVIVTIENADIQKAVAKAVKGTPKITGGSVAYTQREDNKPCDINSQMMVVLNVEITETIA